MVDLTAERSHGATYQNHTAGQAPGLNVATGTDQIEPGAWQGDSPSAAPICCMLEIYEAQRPAQDCSSGACRRDWLQGSLTGSGCSGSEMSNGLSRMYLAQMQIWADSARPCQSTESIRAIVPPRIFSAIMFRAVCALAQRGTFGVAS